MTINGFGNLARHVMMQTQMTSVKGEMDRLGQELASGLKSDVGASLGGDFKALNDINRQLTVLDSYDHALMDAKLFTSTMQTTLDRVQSLTQDLSAALISTASSGVGDSATTASKAAMDDFSTLVHSLNGRSGDKTMFAGAANDGPATISAEEMMTHLSAAVAGAATVNDVIAAVDDWFMAPGGGFETVGYLGSADPLSPFQLNEDASATVDIKADDDAIRALMRDTALAAIANDPGLGLNSADKLELLDTAGKRLLGSQDALTQTRSSLGYAEQKIGISETQNAATRTSLTMARNEITTVDSTEVAGQFQAAQYQLEMVYTITARLNSMSLMDYMR
ncbi:flagellar hook-associated protein 3 FlgL [Shimia isoporae]|uniref:Flagellin n=1 Tax=Shimia isoporae TaxID=647720 RepID=A0A4R1NBE4_9RHOB|nr:flagellin [Shimia isoporae]TCL01429.1 flagellar hook-associated protein 3 FlgL [Shimia isoporae]